MASTELEELQSYPPVWMILVVGDLVVIQIGSCEGAGVLPCLVCDADLCDALLCRRGDVEHHMGAFSWLRSDREPRAEFPRPRPHVA